MHRFYKIIFTIAVFVGGFQCIKADEISEVASEMANYVGGYIEDGIDADSITYVPGIELYNRSSQSSYPETNSYADAIQTIKQTYPDVRNQNPYGTCWSFASNGMAEFDLIHDKTADRTIDLSELQLVYNVFNYTEDPLGGTEGDISQFHMEKSSGRGYLNYGGNYIFALERYAQWVGPFYESDVPYSNALTVLNNGLSEEYSYNNEIAQIKNAYIVNLVDNPSELKELILEHGAAGVSYNAANWPSLDETTGQYTYYDTSNAGNAGHAVMIVGWDDDFPASSFSSDSTQPTSNGAWLIRNSWGSGYYDYFWMSYETYSLNYSSSSTAKKKAAYVFDFDSTTKYDNNYQLDGSAEYTYQTSYGTMANIFSVESKENVQKEELKAVQLSFEGATNVEYTIEIYTDLTDVTNPISGTKKCSQSGKTSLAGKYMIELDSSIYLYPGTYYSVVLTASGTGYAMDIEYATNSSSSAWETKVETQGKTYCLWRYDGTFHEYAQNTEGNHDGNLRLKTFTNNVLGKVEDITHTIVFDSNGGSVSQASKQVIEGSTYGTLPTPTRTGYTFDGWYTSASGGTKVTSSTTMGSSNVTIYAHWTVNGYTLTYNANGGSVSPSSKTIQYGNTYGTLPTPTRTGYTFNGWYTSASGGSQVTSSTKMGASDVTIYAQWTKNATPTPTSTPQPTSTPTPTVQTEKITMHRLYNPNSGEHFYTSSNAEKNNLVNLGWNYEGVGWTAPKSGNPVYRLYNANGGEHHYTLSQRERDGLVRAGWKYEGIGWYSPNASDINAVPLYREYNPNAFANNHNYTTSKAEHDWLISLGWKDEGKAWYGVK